MGPAAARAGEHRSGAPGRGGRPADRARTGGRGEGAVPGVDQAIAADLRNADLFGAILKQGFGGLDPDEMVAEIKARISDELDYSLEARNQTVFADHYRGHPFIHVPEVLPTLSTRRVLTTELVTGHTWSEALTWDQQQRDQIGETLFRFVFRSLYGMHLFNGDPHPGNYLFHGDGKVTFFDYGLVKQFSDDEMHTSSRWYAPPPTNTT
ncbi:MAG: AarF/UbiB family protein [Ilumatobacteraceae bacterium]